MLILMAGISAPALAKEVKLSCEIGTSGSSKEITFNETEQTVDGNKIGESNKKCTMKGTVKTCTVYFLNKKSVGYTKTFVNSDVESNMDPSGESVTSVSRLDGDYEYERTYSRNPHLDTTPVSKSGKCKVFKEPTPMF